MKLFLKLVCLLGITTYIIWSFVFFAKKDDPRVCNALHIVVADSANASFMTAARIENLLKKDNLDPVDKLLDSINTKQIERALLKNAFIKQVTCYIGADRSVNVIAVQRLPVMRVLADNGDDYYIDESGFTMHPLGYPANLVVATGNISPAFARKFLTSLGIFIRNNKFWDNLIEEVHVLPNRELELMPRVGNHVVKLGTTDSIPKKLRNLSNFYQNVLPKVGWNKYEEIDVRYTNQVIGRKRKKA